MSAQDNRGNSGYNGPSMSNGSHANGPAPGVHWHGCACTWCIDGITHPDT